MKIEIKNQGIQFKEVPVGSLFAHPADFYVYMAVEEHNVDGDKINAVNLVDGGVHEFDDYEEVRLLNNAKLVIE